MKYILTTLTLFIFCTISPAQFKSFGFFAGGGYTLIDVQKVNNPMVLSDWNNYSLVFKGFAEYQLREGQLLGLEIGKNRLYYWEYPAPGYSWYNWRTEWTTNAVFYVSKRFGERLFLKAGPGIHIFSNGTVFGLLAAAETSFSISKSISIPIAIRVEPIFGAGTPLAINLATGFKFDLR
jgi:hypothetical protein